MQDKKNSSITKMFERIEKDIKRDILIHRISRYKYIALMIIIICFLIAFHVWTSKTPVNEGHLELEPLISENELIEIDINQQILAQKAEEIGVKRLDNPNITDYLNLYLQKGTIILDFATNEQTTYNDVDVVVKAVKIQNGNTVFAINNKQYYVKD